MKDTGSSVLTRRTLIHPLTSWTSIKAQTHTHTHSHRADKPIDFCGNTVLSPHIVLVYLCDLPSLTHLLSSILLPYMCKCDTWHLSPPPHLSAPFSYQLSWLSLLPFILLLLPSFLILFLRCSFQVHLLLFPFNAPFSLFLLNILLSRWERQWLETWEGGHKLYQCSTH